MAEARITYALAGKRIWVAGHSGMVGGAVLRALANRDVSCLTLARRECDLRDQAAVRRCISESRPDAIIVAAGTVGGIEANRTRPVEFLYDNVTMAVNIIHAAATCGVQKLLYLGSSCCYPPQAAMPVREESLLQGPFERTNEAYALAKVVGMKLCQAYRQEYGQDFIVAVPTNLYGPGDHFQDDSGHVIPALFRRFSEARDRAVDRVALWGTGEPMREFLHVDDAAAAMVWLLENYSSPEMINIAGGEEIRIADLARLIAEIVHYRGELIFDSSKPDGMRRKVLDGSQLQRLGWRPQWSLREGLRHAYDWYCHHSSTPDTLLKRESAIVVPNSSLVAPGASPVLAG